MKFGIGPLGFRRPPGDETPFPAIYESEVALAELAESVGFDSAWVAEHHFAPDGYVPSPIAASGAIAARTTGMEVGIGIALAPLYEPLRLAEDAAVVHQLASAGGGRFALGLGLGYRAIELEAFGIAPEERVPRLLDAVDTCRGAWSEGSFSLDGRAVSYPEVDVTPKPETPPSLVVGAIADAGIERAARVADGYVLAPGFDREGVADRFAVLTDALEAAGRDPAEFDAYWMQYAFVHEDGREAAWEAIREHYLYTRKAYLEYGNESVDSEGSLTGEELEERAAELEDEWRSHVVHGTPGEVVEQLAPYADCYEGELHAICQFHHPGMEYEPARRAIELFGEEIIPDLGWA